MSRIVIVILMYHRHKPIDNIAYLTLIFIFQFISSLHELLIENHLKVVHDIMNTIHINVKLFT
jgi:hypothetical protein